MFDCMSVRPHVSEPIHSSSLSKSKHEPIYGLHGGGVNLENGSQTCRVILTARIKCMANGNRKQNTDANINMQ